jgi:hypothetical protein
LAVRVYARSETSPALSAAFSAVRFGPVDPGVFRFVPPAGATVREAYREVANGREAPATSRPGAEDTAVRGVRILGTGWSSILAVEVTNEAVAGAGAVDGLDLRQFLPFSGPLFSVRLASVDGHTWLLAGAVPQRDLAAAEPGLR